MLKVGVIFCGGLGGIEWALKYENIEHEVVMSAEIDKYARKQYVEFHGEPENFYEDVYEIDGFKYRGKIDLFHASSPCQSFSIAGKRGGKYDKRGNLIEECVRLVDEIRPKVFTYENVQGLMSIDGGKTFKDFIQAYRDLGYFVAHKLINAKECGTAQNRLRLFMVGFLDEDDYHNFSFADSVPLTKCLRDYLEDDVDEKYYLSEKMIKGFMSHGARHKEKVTGFQLKPKTENDIANCLRANAAIAPTDNTIKVGFVNQDTQASTVFSDNGVSPTLCSGTHGYAQGYVKEDKLIQVGELDIKGAYSTKRVYSADGICPTMTTMGGGNRQPKVLLPTLEVGVKSATKSCYEVATENDSINFTHPDSKTRRGRVGKCVAQTLDCACNQGVIEKNNDIFCYGGNQANAAKMLNISPCLTSAMGLGGGHRPIIKSVSNNFRIRKLTPRECFRLMGIRDEDIVLVNSNSQSYKIAGNGIEIESMRSIIRQLYKPVKSSLSLF